MTDAAVLTGVAIAVDGDRIAGLGAIADVERTFPDAETIDCAGRVVTPGLVDSHTHAVFGRPRFDEQELRAAGAGYMEIAERGGGIHSSVRDLRSRSDDDLDLLAQSGTSVAHNPVTFSRSGMILQSVGRYRRRGVNVGLGTDSYPFNMLEEMRQALICSRIAGASVADLDTSGILEVATLGGAKALGRTDIGRIAAGARADFSLVDLRQKGMQPNYDPLRNLLHCAAERAVSAVYVDGACVSRDGRPVNLDYDGALAALQEAQNFAVRHLQENDPQKRPPHMLARPTLAWK